VISIVNEEILTQFSGLNAAGRLAHAYLFVGPKGVGKYATALALAKQVNCLKEGAAWTACDCVSCRKIDGGNHPDILVIEKPEDKTGISIDQIRALKQRLEYRALEAAVKFAIIKDAELIHEEAANAFLKTLEEPRPGTVLILTTAVPDALLSTIRSRCQMVYFPAMSSGALAQVLKSQHHVGADDAVVLAAFGQGSPGRALELGEDFLERRRRVLDAFLGMGDTESFLKAAGTDRDTAREALNVVLMAFRDALFIKAGAGSEIVNRDRQVEIRRFAERYTSEDLASHANRVSDAIRRIDGNQNVKVVLTVVREIL
jgi:DNA polymerase-3 subunit delta'